MFDAVQEKWTSTTFGSIFDFRGGTQPPKSEFIYKPQEGYVRLLQIRDFESEDHPAYIKESSTKNRCSEYDILIARYGASLGRILTGKAGSYNVALVKLLIDERTVDRSFSYFWLQSDYFQDRLKAIGNRSAQAGFNKEDLADFPILLPPLDEQRRIAEVLRSVDEAISATQNIVEHQAKLWQNLAEELIWGDGTKSLRPLGTALIGSDYGVNVPLNTEGLGKPVLRMGNIQDGQIDMADIKWGEIADKEAQALKLNKGDILFNRTNSRDLVGKVALVREATDCLYASYIVRLVIDRTIAEPYYVFAVMHSDRAQSVFKAIATPGVSQSNINPTNLKKQMVPLPPISKQTAAAEQLNAIEISRLFAKRELENLRVIKQDIASNLLSGRVRVPA